MDVAAARQSPRRAIERAPRGLSAAGLALAETDGREGHALPQIVVHLAGRLARNPLILAILCGGAASLNGLVLPGSPAKAIDMLAAASAGVALFTVGGALDDLQVKGMLGDIARIVAAKLFLHRALVFLALRARPQSATSESHADFRQRADVHRLSANRAAPWAEAGRRRRADGGNEPVLPDDLGPLAARLIPCPDVDRSARPKPRRFRATGRRRDVQQLDAAVGGEGEALDPALAFNPFQHIAQGRAIDGWCPRAA